MYNFKILLFPLLLLLCKTLPAQLKKFSPDQKEHFIQQALQERENGNYIEAIAQLNLILTALPEDAPILLLKGDIQAQNKQFDAAAVTYQRLLDLNYEKTIARINLSYALFMTHNPSEALTYAREAWEEDEKNTRAVINYFNALLWNVRTGAATVFLQDHQSILAEDQLLVMKARLYTTRGDYRKGLAHYDTLVYQYPDKYYAREYLEVMLAKKEINQTLVMLDSLKGLFNVREYDSIAKKLQISRQQHAGASFDYFHDVAKNTRTGQNIWWQQSQGRKFRFGLTAGKSTNTSLQNEQTHSWHTGITINERWNSVLQGETSISLLKVATNEQRNFTSLYAKQSLKYQPTDRMMMGVFYQTEALNYTASLLSQNIRLHNLGYRTHIMTDAKTGIYSEGSYGLSSDSNRRIQFFGSFYHLVNTRPLLKTGVNVSLLHYDLQNITQYFSPDLYLSTEVFGQYSSQIPGLSGLRFNTEAAAGMQQIEDQGWNAAFRLRAELAFRSEHFESSLKYQTSNVASQNGTGYKFQWLTFQLIFKW